MTGTGLPPDGGAHYRARLAVVRAEKLARVPYRLSIRQNYLVRMRGVFTNTRYGSTVKLAWHRLWKRSSRGPLPGGKRATTVCTYSTKNRSKLYKHVLQKFYTTTNVWGELVIEPLIQGRNSAQPSSQLSFRRYVQHGLDISFPHGASVV